VNRVELSGEAIRLARMVHGLRPADAEVTGLLALMLLTDARRPARSGPAGELIPLAEQDRSRWDRALIAEGITLLVSIPVGTVMGEYHLLAAVGAAHDRAASVQDTDWPQILALYGLLERLTANPMVTLNRAVATAMATGPDGGPAAGLAILDGLAGPLAGHYRLDAVRAHLLEMAGDRAGAVTHYRAAAARTTNTAEQHYLMLKAARLG
jgi:predicted RNA polymerase sigma factor